MICNGPQPNVEIRFWSNSKLYFANGFDLNIRQHLGACVGRDIDFITLMLRVLKFHCSFIVSVHFILSGGGLLSKKEGVRERDRLINELEDLQKRLQTQTKYVDELEEKHAEAEEKIKDLYRQLEDVSNDAFKGKRSFEQISNKLQETTDEKQFIAEELKKFKQQVHLTFTRSLIRKENFFLIEIYSYRLKSNIVLSFNRTCKCWVSVPIWISRRRKIISIIWSWRDWLVWMNIKRNEGIIYNIIKLSADLDNVTQLKDKLTNDLNTKNNILKLKEDENAKFRLENAKIIKSREILMKKMMTIDASKVALENEILKLRLRDLKADWN